MADEGWPLSARPVKASSPQPLLGLIVTQSSPRDGTAVEAMARFVKEGGVFSPETMILHAQSRSASAEDDGQVEGVETEHHHHHQQQQQQKKNNTNKHNKNKNMKQQRPVVQYRRTNAQLRAACAPILLAHLPDDRLYVWDGHHRVAAIHLGGRDHLLAEEYSTMRCNFKFAQTVSFATWFLTPFDPRTEIRVPEFGSFKNEVAVLLKKKKKPEAEVVEYIVSNRHMYVLPRTFESVEEMVVHMVLTQRPTTLPDEAKV